MEKQEAIKRQGSWKFGGGGVGAQLCRAQWSSRGLLVASTERFRDSKSRKAAAPLLPLPSIESR